MPNRILRDWTTSQTVDRLTTEQENAFTRLLMAVDDFGRYHADPRLLLARLYPLRVCTKSAQQMHSIRDALATHGLIKVYDVQGNEFLQIVKWENVPRAKTSKYPACTADAQQMRSRCVASAPVTVTVTATEDRNRAGVVVHEKPDIDNPVQLYSEGFKLLVKASPRRVSNEYEVHREYEAIPNRPSDAYLLECMEAMKRQKGEDWTKDGGKYAPALTRWLRERMYLQSGVAPEGMQDGDKREGYPREFVRPRDWSDWSLEEQEHHITQWKSR